jgi:hypothetical protein
MNDVASRMNYHRQAAHALKEGKNYNDLPKDLRDQISWHLSERSRLNGLLIEMKNAAGVRVVPAYSVESLLSRVDELVVAKKRFIEDVGFFKPGTKTVALTNTFLDIGSILQNTGAALTIESASRGTIQLYRGRSLFFTDDADAGAVHSKVMKFRTLASAKDYNFGLAASLDNDLNLINVWIGFYNQHLTAAYPVQDAWSDFKQLYRRTAGKWVPR